MKKITTILVCLLLVASLAVTAFAADLDMTLTADKTTVKAGDVVTLTIATPAAELKAGGFNLEGCYDADVFEFVGGDCPLDGTMLEKVGVTGGKLSGSFMYMAATPVSGPIFTVQLKVKDTAALGKTTIAPTASARDAAGAVEVAINSLDLKIVCAEHTWNEGEVTKEATCTAEGAKSFACSVCGETKTEAIEMLPHTEKVTVKEATCTAEGLKTVSCSVCKETISSEKIAKLPHTEKATVKKATCTAEGEKVVACTVCETVLSTEKIAKLPHTPGEAKVTKEATCAAEGQKAVACTACKTVLSTEKIAKLDHTWDNGKVTKAPTTKKEGVKTYTCTVCGATKTEAIEKVETPATGDNSMIVAFVALLVMSAAGIAVTVIGKKKVA